MLFLFFVGIKRWAKTKCAFSFAVGYLICFFSHKGRMEYQTEECSLQTQEYKFQTFQYNLQSRKYDLQRQEYNTQSCQYNLQSKEYKKILTEYSVRIQECKNTTL